MTTRTRSAGKKKAADPMDGAAILARVKPQRRRESTTVCLRADLVSAFEAEDAELVRLKVEAAGNTNRLNSGAEPDSEAIRAQARKVQKIENQIVDSQTTFVFEARNKDEWAEITANHPPRKKNQMDLMVGYDRDAVITTLVRECMVQPVFADCTVQEETGQPCAHEDCGSWQQLVKVINPSEWNELRDTANLANSGVVDPPKSLLASRILDRRGPASA